MNSGENGKSNIKQQLYLNVVDSKRHVRQLKKKKVFAANCISQLLKSALQKKLTKGNFGPMEALPINHQNA